MSPAWPPDRRTWAALAGTAAVGLAVRVAYVLTAVRGRIPLIGDAETYHLLGRMLAGGHGYIRPREFLADGRVVPTAEFPPLHPTVLAALDLLGVDTPTGQRLAGAALGAVSVVVIGLLGCALAGPAVGVTAAAVAAVYPQLVMFDGSLLSEGLYVLLISGALLAVVRARAAEGSARTRWWVGAGAAVGLATLTRSEAVLLLPALLLPATRRPGDGTRTWVRTFAGAAAGVVVCVGAWTVRNTVALGHVVPFTNNSGTLVAGSNCPPVYWGDQTGLWRLDCVLAIPVAGLDETEAAARYRDEGVRFALDHPGRLAVVVAVRVARTVGLWDVPSHLRFESLEGRPEGWLWAGWAAWVLLAAAAGAGGVVLARRKADLWPLLVPVAVALVTTAAGYGNQRFRVVAEPTVVVLAAAGLTAAVGAARQRRAGQAQAPGGSS